MVVSVTVAAPSLEARYGGLGAFRGQTGEHLGGFAVALERRLEALSRNDVAMAQAEYAWKFASLRKFICEPTADAEHGAGLLNGDCLGLGLGRCWHRLLLHGSFTAFLIYTGKCYTVSPMFEIRSKVTDG